MRARLFTLTLILMLLAGTLAGAWLFLGQRDDHGIQRLGTDDDEIALIEPATNTDDWGRLVAALQALEKDWPFLFPQEPALKASLQAAFPPLTADIPQIEIGYVGEPRKLWLRWYKLGGDQDVVSWLGRLQRRGKSPLAILGGGTSGRAIRLARALDASKEQWPGHPPLFLITTATAEVDERVDGKKLSSLYRGRTFRYCFTNGKMVDAVLRFVRQNPQIWVHKNAGAEGPAQAIAAANVWTAFGLILASGHLDNFSLHVAHWEDDSYSRDLAELFREFFRAQFPDGDFFEIGGIPYSVGDVLHPNPTEQAAVGTLLAERSPFPPHSLVVLPTSSQRMRRMLANLRSRAPLDVRNLVILNGDAINFNTVFRDRNYSWNIQDLPFSLVFFSHRNPIDADTGFDWSATTASSTRTGTHDLLLYRDIIESLLYACRNGGKFEPNAGELAGRLKETRWYQVAQPDTHNYRVTNARIHPWAAEARAFFDADGNRQRHTGEHIVWLRPNYSGDRLDLISTLSVWEEHNARWQPIASHEPTYNE